jgi:hypothetical protein
MIYDGKIAPDYAELRHIRRPLLKVLISGSGIHAGLTDIQFDFVLNLDAIHHYQDRARESAQPTTG